MVTFLRASKGISASSVHACLEATGSYGDGVALFLHEQGYVVSLINPLRIKGYAAAKLQRNKTDQADTRLIAEFCAKETPAPWTPPAPEIRHLQALNRRIETLTEMQQMEKNRCDTAPAETHESLDRIITALAQEIARLQTVECAKPSTFPPLSLCATTRLSNNSPIA